MQPGTESLTPTQIAVDASRELEKNNEQLSPLRICSSCSVTPPTAVDVYTGNLHRITGCIMMLCCSGSSKQNNMHTAVFQGCHVPDALAPVTVTWQPRTSRPLQQTHSINNVNLISIAVPHMFLKLGILNRTSRTCILHRLMFTA